MTFREISMPYTRFERHFRYYESKELKINSIDTITITAEEIEERKSCCCFRTKKIRHTPELHTLSQFTLKDADKTLQYTNVVDGNVIHHVIFISDSEFLALCHIQRSRELIAKS
jgi:hypothetical protein